MTATPREKLWVVRPGDGSTVADVLRLAGEGLEAVDEGRVFIGRKRATRDDAPVEPGDAVRIGASRARARDGTGPPEVAILFEKDGLVACIKPAGIPTVPDHGAASHALITVVAERVGAKRGTLIVTSRLDREVSGVVIFALGAAAAERLERARAEGQYRRRYVAIAAGDLGAATEDRCEGIWTAGIGRAAVPRLRAADGPQPKFARTAFARVAVARVAGAVAGSAIPFSMLAVDPRTGRTHQIRVHASHAGAPLVGDRDYGGPMKVALPKGAIVTTSRIALHAARIVVPGIDGPIEANAPVPAELRNLWASLGGAPEAWSDALAATTPAPARLARRRQP